MRHCNRNVIWGKIIEFVTHILCLYYNYKIRCVFIKKFIGIIFKNVGKIKLLVKELAKNIFFSLLLITVNYINTTKILDFFRLFQNGHLLFQEIVIDIQFLQFISIIDKPFLYSNSYFLPLSHSAHLPGRSSLCALSKLH